MRRNRHDIRTLASRTLNAAYAFPLALVALAVLKFALARALITGGWDVPAAFVLETAAVVTILGVVDQLGRRRPYLLDLAAYALLCCVLLANVVYISEFARPIDPRMLVVADQAGETWDSVVALLRPSQALFVLDIPLLALWAWRLRRRARASAPSRPLRALEIGMVAAALAVLSTQATIAARVPEDANPIAVIAGRGFGPSQTAALLRIATAAGRPRERVKLSLGNGAEVQRTIDSIRHGSDGTRIATFIPGAYKGKNVILIQVETLQAMAIGARLGGQEVTPNLNRLAEESWYFPNTFSQAGSGVTADAEFVANSGLYGPVTGYASVAYADRQIPALPRLLRAAGYDAITLHQNYASFWNRAQLYPALGFRRYYDHDFFGDREQMWHASDCVLFQDGLRVLGQLQASGQPFYAQFVTMTSHSPFRYPTVARRPLKVPAKWANSPVAKWASAQSYTDMAIGEFIGGLKKQGLYDDSIVVVYGDHSGMQVSEMTSTDDEVVRALIGRSFTPADRQRVAFIVHLPGQTKAERDDSAAGTVDIMPTIADLTGLDISSVPHLGRSVFVDAPSFVPMRAFVPTGTFFNDRVMLVPGLSFEESKAYLIGDGSPTKATDTERADLERQRRLNEISEQWIRSLPRRPDAPEHMDKGFEVTK